MTLRIECTGSTTVALADLVHFQGELKSLSEENYKRFSAQMLKLGFSSPFHVWVAPSGEKKLLDGHQRLAVITRMAREGVEVPSAYPAVEVGAASESEAKEKVLALASQYGVVEKKGLEAFVADLNLTPLQLNETFRLPEVNLLNLQTKEPAGGNTDPDEIPEAGETRVKPGDLWLLGAYLECDKCGHITDYDAAQVDKECSKCCA